jgi:hypothetical protein
LKSRSNHENGTSKKQTWSALADLYNNTEPDPMMDNFDDTAIKDLHNHFIWNPVYDDIDLTNFTEMTDNGNDLQKYIMGLFKLQREMKAMMTTVSRTHNNDAMAFVNHAKARVKNASAHQLALYYFFVKCEEFPHVDDEFASSLPEEMKGSSHSKPPTEIVMAMPGGASIASSKSTVKKATTNDFSDASVQAFCNIAAAMKEKHNTDKIFHCLQMDGVSPITKRNIQETRLQEF